MKVKIDTKERMHVITVEEEELTANMTEQLIKQVHSYLNSPVQNVILIFPFLHYQTRICTTKPK